MKLKSATALLASSLALFVASLAVAQQAPQQPQRQIPTVGPRALPILPPVVPIAGSQQRGDAGAGGGGIVVSPPARPGQQAGRPRDRAGAQNNAAQQAAAAQNQDPGAGAGAGAGAGQAAGGPQAAGGRITDITQAGGNLRPFETGVAFDPLPPGARITFNLQDADLPDLIRAIGNITGKRFILSGKLRAIKATVYSPTKVRPDEAYAAFLSVLDANGMTVVPAGRFYRIEESAGIATNPLPTYAAGEAAPALDQYITRVHRLRNMSADDAATVLGHFKSRDGDITPFAATNTVILTDTGANIRRMMQILAEIDQPSVGEQIWVERIHYANSSELATRITELLGGGGGGGGGGGARPASGDMRLTRILSDDRSNSLIIVATDRMYLRVLELIRRLDVPVEGEGEVHVYYLQHADADELANTLNQITGGGRQGGSQGAANRGATSVFEGPIRITADKRTNALVINSSPRDYASVRHVIGELDRARRQVFIEAVVMELGVNNTTKLGVSWHSGARPAPDTLALGGFQAVPTSVGFPLSLASNQDALQGLALGVAGPAIPMSQNLLGLTLGIPSFGAVVTALAQSGDGDVLATPSIIATDNSPADINVGQNIPLQTNVGGIGALAGLAGAAGGSAGALGGLGALGLGGLGGFAAPRQDVGTKIRVVPHINDSNEIRLEIDEEISEAGDPVGALGVVPINKRNAKTTVVVQDQQTVVIGGLIRNSVRRGTTRIPILGDLPLIGVLFRSENRTVERRNLLLFLTPYVIRDQSDLRRIFERKMRERQEFLDRYFVFSDTGDYHPPIDYARTNGLVEEVRQAIRQMREQAELESRAIPRLPPPHTISHPIDLPAEVRAGAAAGGGGGGGAAARSDDAAQGGGGGGQGQGQGGGNPQGPVVVQPAAGNPFRLPFIAPVQVAPAAQGQGAGGGGAGGGGGGAGGGGGGQPQGPR